MPAPRSHRPRGGGAGIAVRGHGDMADAEGFRQLETAMTRPRALNEPVGRRPSSLTRISPLPSFLGQTRQRDQRLALLARETDNVPRFARTGTQFAIACHRSCGRSMSASFGSSALLHSRRRSVAHQKRRADRAAEIVRPYPLNSPRSMRIPRRHEGGACPLQFEDRGVIADGLFIGPLLLRASPYAHYGAGGPRANRPGPAEKIHAFALSPPRSKWRVQPALEARA